MQPEKTKFKQVGTLSCTLCLGKLGLERDLPEAEELTQAEGAALQHPHGDCSGWDGHYG